MQINIGELVERAGLEESVYPGKKSGTAFTPPGEFRSHTVCMNWNDRNTIQIQLTAGTTGNTPELSDLQRYPVSLQAKTSVEIAVSRDAEDSEASLSTSAFDQARRNEIPTEGEITQVVIMGKELDPQQFGPALDSLLDQMGGDKIDPIQMLNDAGQVVRRVTPSGGRDAKGEETINYEYDPERNAGLFGGMAPS